MAKRALVGIRAAGMPPPAISARWVTKMHFHAPAIAQACVRPHLSGVVHDAPRGPTLVTRATTSMELIPMAASLIVEEESGTYDRSPHAHNGYFAGDFSDQPMLTNIQLAALTALSGKPS